MMIHCKTVCIYISVPVVSTTAGRTCLGLFIVPPALSSAPPVLCNAPPVLYDAPPALSGGSSVLCNATPVCLVHRQSSAMHHHQVKGTAGPVYCTAIAVHFATSARPAFKEFGGGGGGKGSGQHPVFIFAKKESKHLLRVVMV